MNDQPVALPVVAVGDTRGRLADLFDVHYQRLYRLARRLAASQDDALDLVQETFLKAARSPNAIPAGVADEEAWLVRVLINIRRDQWRKSAVRNRHENAGPAATRMATGTPSPEEAFIAGATVWQALDILPPRRRAIVVMHELDGMAVPAIASLIGISAITVRWHLSMGRRELAQALKSSPGAPNA